MRSWRGFRKGAQWLSATFVVVTTIAWAGSRWYRASWVSSAGYLVQINGGAVEGFDMGPPADGGGILVQRRRGTDFRWGFSRHSNSALSVSLWPLILIAGGSAAALWRLDDPGCRRHRFLRCHSCSYDRRGLAADAKCPECGTVPAQ